MCRRRWIYTLGDNLSAETVVVAVLDKSEIDIVLPAWHKTVDDDDGFVNLVFDADEYSLPRGSVDVYRQTLGECIGDNGLSFTAPCSVVPLGVVRVGIIFCERCKGWVEVAIESG